MQGLRTRKRNEQVNEQGLDFKERKAKASFRLKRGAKPRGPYHQISIDRSVGLCSQTLRKRK